MDQALLQQLAQELGATPARMGHIQMAPTLETARARLTQLKVEAKATYRKLAFQYHPDRNPGDAAAEAKFKALGSVLQEIEKTEIRPPARPVVVGICVQRVPGRVSIYQNTGTSATTSTFYDARRVVFVS